MFVRLHSTIDAKLWTRCTQSHCLPSSLTSCQKPLKTFLLTLHELVRIHLMIVPCMNFHFFRKYASNEYQVRSTRVSVVTVDLIWTTVNVILQWYFSLFYALCSGLSVHVYIVYAKSAKAVLAHLWQLYLTPDALDTWCTESECWSVTNNIFLTQVSVDKKRVNN